MAKLIMYRDQIKKIYAKSGAYINHVLTFVLAFLAMLVMGRSIGSDGMISSPLIALTLALICSFFPFNVTVIVATLYLVLLLFGLSVELAIIATCIILVIYLLYFRFAPKTGFILLLTPILYFIKIPYVIPIVVALTVGVGGIVPTVGGVFIYYLIDFASSYQTTITTLDADNALQNIQFIFNNILTSKELIVVIISFSLVITLVYFVKRLSFAYAWPVAIVSGSVIDALIQIIAFLVLSVKYNLPMMLIGHVVAIAVGIVLNFFCFSVDFSATEIVQFEDDDYYYYVKAVPKVTVATEKVRLKKINEQEMTDGIYTEDYEDEEDTIKF